MNFLWFRNEQTSAIGWEFKVYNDGKKLDYLYNHVSIFKDIINYECEVYLKEPLTPLKIIVANCTSNPRLAIESNWLLTILILRGRWCIGSLGHKTYFYM